MNFIGNLKWRTENILNLLEIHLSIQLYNLKLERTNDIHKAMKLKFEIYFKNKIYINYFTRKQIYINFTLISDNLADFHLSWLFFKFLLNVHFRLLTISAQLVSEIRMLVQLFKTVNLFPISMKVGAIAV